MSKLVIATVLLVWGLWYVGPKIGPRTPEYPTFEWCEDTAKRINQENEWGLWCMDPKMGLRISQYPTFEECEDTAKRINQESERRRRSNPLYRIYFGTAAFCYQKLGT